MVRNSLVHIDIDATDTALGLGVLAGGMSCPVPMRLDVADLREVETAPFPVRGRCVAV